MNAPCILYERHTEYNNSTSWKMRISDKWRIAESIHIQQRQIPQSRSVQILAPHTHTQNTSMHVKYFIHERNTNLSMTSQVIACRLRGWRTLRICIYATVSPAKYSTVFHTPNAYTYKHNAHMDMYTWIYSYVIMIIAFCEWMESCGTICWRCSPSGPWRTVRYGIEAEEEKVCDKDGRYGRTLPFYII